MNDTKLLVKAYLDRKDGKLPSAYNFDLAEMMKNFNFYDFCAEAKGSRNYSVEHGALLVITDRQYILSYNSSFGIGSHAATSVRVYADIHGIGKVHNNRTASEMYSKCVFQYITARIAYDRDSGFIHFVCQDFILFYGKIISCCMYWVGHIFIESDLVIYYEQQ